MMVRGSATSLNALACGFAYAAIAAAPAAAQQAIIIRQGTTDTTAKAVGGTDSITVEAGGTLSTTTNPAINWATASTDLRITNAGTVRSTASGGRAINASGANNVRTVTLVNTAGALIESADDAFRINVAPTAGTIRVDNFGVIRTTGGGQALDFDAVSGNATIIINNNAGAELRSVGQDAVRPGQGAIVTNGGLIQSDGPANNSYDGIDWQARSGTVVNAAGGTISGLRHGITGDVAVDVTNRGTITGRNGSGVGSDGTGTVVNFGTITGVWDGVATNGDGDGVDIDFVGTVRNFGTIQGLTATGVDSGGRPNSAQGVAIGGGTVENAAGAIILGGAQAILVNHDTNPGGVADAATTITNAGTIRGQAGEGILLVGTFDDTITNSGLIAGQGVALDMGAGNDTLNVATGAAFIGSVNGGAGTDRVNLTGTGTGSFGATSGFEALAVTGGSWTLTAPAIYANGISVANGATLAGTTATLANQIAVAGTLVFDQATDGTLATSISGAGQLVKAGTGTLTVRDQTGFTGRTNVNAGRLVLAGALPAAVTVASGAILAGTGTVASLSVAAGGTVAPGTSPGTITVAGAFTQAAGSTYAAETTAAGASDRIVVGGAATIGSGATLAVSRDGGSYAIGARYTLLTASGGITGAYTLSQAASGGTEFRIVQGLTALDVVVARSGASLAGVAQTGNQRAAAAGVAALGAGNAANAALTLVGDDGAVRGALDGLSGEIHAAQRGTMLRAAAAGTDAVRGRMSASVEGVGLWGQALALRGDDQDHADTAGARRKGWGGFGGVDLGLDTVRIGIAGGYTRTDLTLPRRDSQARVEGRHLLGYAGGTLGPVALRVTAGYAWTRTETARAFAFAGFAARAAARYHGDVLHGAAEAGIARPFAGGTVEPFAGVEVYRIHTDAFAEGAGAAALSAAGTTDSFTLSNLGLRAGTPIASRLSARARAAWQHVFDERRPQAMLRFAGAATPFTVSGAPLSRDAAAVSLDLAWRPVEKVTVSAGYAGLIGDAGDDSRLRAGLAVAF